MELAAHRGGAFPSEASGSVAGSAVVRQSHQLLTASSPSGPACTPLVPRTTEDPASGAWRGPGGVAEDLHRMVVMGIANAPLPSRLFPPGAWSPSRLFHRLEGLEDDEVSSGEEAC